MLVAVRRIGAGDQRRVASGVIGTGSRGRCRWCGVGCRRAALCTLHVVPHRAGMCRRSAVSSLFCRRREQTLRHIGARRTASLERDQPQSSMRLRLRSPPASVRATSWWRRQRIRSVARYRHSHLHNASFRSIALRHTLQPLPPCGQPRAASSTLTWHHPSAVLRHLWDGVAIQARNRLAGRPVKSHLACAWLARTVGATVNHEYCIITTMRPGRLDRSSDHP